MDWDFAIQRHRGPLLRIVAGLFVMIGLTEGGVVERVSRPLYRLVLGRLRTAESAVRRLIFVAARNIVVEPKPRRPAQAGRKSSGESNGQETGKTKRKRGVFFRLFDPPKRFKESYGRHFKKLRRPEPRVTIIDLGYDPSGPTIRLFQPPPAAPAPVPEEDEAIEDGTVDAGPLIRRLMAITDALQDIPRHAMRLARWQSQPVEERHPPRSSPLRPGRPPGFRQRAKHEVDDILKECHWLARNVEPPLDDTS